MFFYLLFLFLCDKIKFKRKNAKEEKIYMQSLPIGLQTFKTIRNEDFIYIDWWLRFKKIKEKKRPMPLPSKL